MRLTYKDKYGHWCSDGSKASLQLGNPRENWPSILWGDAVDKLAAYEDAEEQGRLVILPCKVGDMVYYRRGRDIIGDTVERIIIDGIDNQVLVGAHRAFMFCDFGRNAFLTREEAKAALTGEQTDV
ncbi:MAG: hypothetical protein J6Y20_01320 [Lachnospiraceae bacterium]|nr:hypothetical protein [Lachnospiraceae bacterium]